MMPDACKKPATGTKPHLRRSMTAPSTACRSSLACDVVMLRERVWSGCPATESFMARPSIEARFENPSCDSGCFDPGIDVFLTL